MLQIVATLVSLIIACGALALIVGILADDWRSLVRALRNTGDLQLSPVQPRVTAGGRRAHIVRVSGRPVPVRAAA
jgi:hypothetical protein